MSEKPERTKIAIRRRGTQAMDIAHAVPFGAPVDVRAGALADAAGATLAVIAAGVAQGWRRAA